MKKSTFDLTVRGYELDSFGHVNNAVYLQYAEAALWNFLRVNGLLEILTAEGLFPVILESRQRYIHAEKVRRGKDRYGSILHLRRCQL